MLWPSCTSDRLVRVALKSSVASSSFSDSIVSWMTRSSCSSGVREVRAPCVEDRIKLGVQFSCAGWVSFASVLDNAILQLALHAVHLYTEVLVESVWSRSSSSNWLSPLSLSLSLLQSRTRGSRPDHGTVFFPLASATCLLLRVSHSAPAVQVASLVKRDHHSAQQLLLFTVVTVVVPRTLCFFTVSLSLSLFAPVLGSGPVVYLQALFRGKDGLRRRPTHYLHTAFTAHLASRTRSCKFTLHSAIARRIGDGRKQTA